MENIKTEIYKSTFAYNIINNDIKNGMLNHAYLLSSEDFELNKLLCLQIAKHILCLGDNKPCENCVNCNKIEHSNMVDLKIFNEDSKGFVVEDANKIVEDSLVLPYENNKKIYIINSFETATIQAQNKLLKTIEEPSGSVVFLINTTNLNKVLNTILSRTKKINISMLNTNLICEYLKSLNVQNAMQFANIAVGNLTKAIKYSANVKFLEINNLAVETFANLKTSADVLEFSYKASQYSAFIKDFLNSLVVVAYDLCAILVNKDERVKNVEHIKTLKGISCNYNVQMLNQIIKLINVAILKLDSNCNVQSVVDNLFMNILEAKYKCKK